MSHHHHDHEPLVVGGVYAALIVLFTPQTGASFLLARSLGPAIVLGSYAYLSVYVYAQMTGTAVVVVGWCVVFFWRGK
jgi:glycerol uptake facilitator-like aquaporin